MKYAFGKYILDVELEVLFLDNTPVLLEPKQYSTLLLFCQSNNKIVSRELLLEVIWQGTIVSENTINKHIAGLRRVLGDDAKSPSYISTVPRKGYRFITTATLGNREDIKVTARRKSTNHNLALLCLLVVVILGLALTWQKGATNTDDILSLTRMEGDKRELSFYKDDTTTIFVNQKHANSELYLQDLTTRKTTIIQHEFDSILNLTGVLGREQLFIVAQKAQRTYLSAGLITDNKLSIQSDLDITGMTVFDMDYTGDNLYLIAQSSSLNSRGLYQVTDELTKLVPIYVPTDQVLLSRVDSAQNNSKLLLLGQRPDSRSVIFSYSITDKKLEQIHQYDSYIRDVIWHYDGILYSDTPPAQRVFFFKPDSFKKPNIVATSSEYLCCETIYSETNKQLIYRTNTTNYQIDWLGETRWSIDNSTVYDMMPSLFHNKRGLVFVSKRTGKSQLYYQQQGARAQQLSQFSRYRIIRALDVSPDDKKIVTIGDSAVFLHSITTGQQVTMKNFEGTSWLVDIAWLDERYFVIKHQSKMTSWLEIYDVNFELVSKLPSQWRQLFADQQDPSLWFGLHSEHGIVQLSPQDVLELQPLVNQQVTPWTQNKDRKIVKDGQFFYQLKGDKKGLQKFNHRAELIETFPVQRAYGFDVRQSNVIISDRVYHSSNWHASGVSQ